MQSNTVPPAKIFSGDRRYVVPLFQRPYVWQQEEQWAPLWDDVRLLAERVPTDPQAYDAPPVPPHFLGAIVLDQMQTATGYLEVRHVVDGQQRLTTLQLLLSAVADVVRELGDPMDTQALKSLVTNQLTQTPDDAFKVWPTNQDRAAFRAAMGDGKKGSSRIEDAWTFFRAAAATWARDGQDPAARLRALTSALRNHLRLVVIDLEPGDNAQVIFETLNHRGAPLLASDLIKNHLFQGAQARNLDVQSLYDDYWKQLDSDHWRELVAQGRRNRPRIDIFLTYWLTMKTLKEVPVDHVFDVFKTATAGTPVEETITELARDADVYRKMEALPPGSVEGAFYYRVLRALDTAAVGPFLLWLLRWPETELPVEQRHRALSAVESWLVRRTLCRLTQTDLNNVVLALLRAVAEAGPATAGEVTKTFLAGQTATSRQWPGDEAVLAALAELPLYETITRPRLRMILERLEDDLRGELGEGQPCPLRLTVEHVMPQGWRTYWNDGLDELSSIARAQPGQPDVGEQQAESISVERAVDVSRGEGGRSEGRRKEVLAVGAQHAQAQRPARRAA